MCETLRLGFVASSVAWNITNIDIYDKIMWSRSIYVMNNGNTSVVEIQQIVNIMSKRSYSTML